LAVRKESFTLKCLRPIYFSKFHDSIWFGKTALTLATAKLTPLRSLAALSRASTRYTFVALKKQRVQTPAQRYFKLFARMATLDSTAKRLISKSYPQAKEIDSDPVKISSAVFDNAEVRCFLPNNSAPGSN
jgi:hypothetical protein